MRRIALIGSGGSGKSTLARQMGEILGIEVFHLDRLHWKPGWRGWGKANRCSTSGLSREAATFLAGLKQD